MSDLLGDGVTSISWVGINEDGVTRRPIGSIATCVCGARIIRPPESDWTHDPAVRDEPCHDPRPRTGS